MPDDEERLVLVDERDRELGTAGKLTAHQDGRLHRAISVVIRDCRGRLLLQKRAAGKYHSGGLWTNTCCSHPRPGEPNAEAAARRLQEEMGFACPLLPLFVTRYRAGLDNGLTEHELVHVFGGLYDGPVQPDRTEADGYAWVEPAWLRADLMAAPRSYSIWFRIYLVQHWDEIMASDVWSRLGAVKAHA